MSATPTAKAVINLDLEGPVISRHLYGHFAEHLGRCIYDGFYVGEDSPIPNEGGIRLDVVQALRQLNIPNLRWPGGCFADEYHWMDGIGPKKSRPGMVNTNWGNVGENNHFGTHEFMALCELLGADPYVNGNVGSGSVREMSNWVEYLTGSDDSPMGQLRRENGREEPWQVPFWGIGNEAWGCGGNMRAEQYADLARQYATFCRDHGDNKLYRIAAGASDDNYGWTETLMKAVNCLGCQREPDRHFQGLSFHYYTVPGTWENKGIATEFTVEDYYRTMVKARKVDELITGHSRVMDCYDPNKRLGLVLDEWGTWWNVEEGTNPGFLYQQNTLRDALVASVHFDIFHRHADRLAMANIAQTVNVLQAMVLTDGEQLVLTPTYHVFEMNKGHHDAASLQVHLQSPATKREVGDDQLETLSLSASVKNDKVLISLTNLDAERPVSLELDLRGRRVGAATARILTAETLQSHNKAGAETTVGVRDFDGVAAAETGLRVELPAHAFVTISAPLVS
jgi:alpha-L-arabinofuranosidase